MKKISLVVLMLVIVCGSISAQKGEKSVGLNLGYGTEVKNFKVGANFKYGITEAIRLVPSFDYFFKKNGASLWSANVDVNYLFSVADKFKVYPIAGLTLAGLSGDSGKDAMGDVDWEDIPGFDKEEMESESSGSITRFGVNLGAGAQYSLTNNIDLNFEIKYQVLKDLGQCVFGVGAAYKF